MGIGSGVSRLEKGICVVVIATGLLLGAVIVYGAYQFHKSIENQKHKAAHPGCYCMPVCECDPCKCVQLIERRP